MLLNVLLVLTLGAFLFTLTGIVRHGRRVRALKDSDQASTDMAVYTGTAPVTGWLPDFTEAFVDAEIVDTHNLPTQVLDVVAGDWDLPTAPQEALVGKKVRRLKKLAPVVDDLGEWEPWTVDQEEALILGDVLAARRWTKLRPVDVGMRT